MEKEMFRTESFLQIAIPPTTDQSHWLQGAEDAVQYLVDISRSNELILHAIMGQAYIHGVLVPLKNLRSVNMDQLREENADPYWTWGIDQLDDKEKLSLFTPFDYPNEVLSGGEQLVFLRRFEGVESKSSIEISQRLVHALDLYWQEEQSAYCRLNEDGDVERTIRLIDLDPGPAKDKERIVTIDAQQLNKYMVVTETALCLKFDFTRYGSGQFHGWYGSGEIRNPTTDLCYHTATQANSSYANGVLIVRPSLTHDDLIAQIKDAQVTKQYATFKAYDWKTASVKDISCAPDALASYFEDSPLPFEVTPAFFRSEVLQRYKADPEIYTVESRSIRSRAGWYLKTYDVNEEGQIHTYLCYLGDLPYKEQLYWQSFNEAPKGPISKRAYETDIQGRFTTVEDPLSELKSGILALNAAPQDWWIPRTSELLSKTLYPVTTSPDEWADSIFLLNQLVIDGISSKVLRDRLSALGLQCEAGEAPTSLLRTYLVALGVPEDHTSSLLAPLNELRRLQSKLRSDIAGSEMQELVKAIRKEHNGSLSDHFRFLAASCYTSFTEIVQHLMAQVLIGAKKTVQNQTTTVQEDKESGVDVLIVAALPIEYSSLREALRISDWIEVGTNDHFPYERASYRCKTGKTLEIAIARPTRMGPTSTSPVVTALTERLKPGCLAMSGVCAGNPEQLTLGDVIISEITYPYEEGKLHVDGFLPDHRQAIMLDTWIRAAQDLKPNDLTCFTDEISDDDRKLWLLQQLTESPTKDPWKHPARDRYFSEMNWKTSVEAYLAAKLLKRARTKVGGLAIARAGKNLWQDFIYIEKQPITALPLKIHVGPIASGSAVLKDGLVWQKLVNQGVRSILGAEMEAASIGFNAHKFNIQKWVVVKSVMDYANIDKDDRFKTFAARASAEVLIRFLDQQLSVN